MQSRMPYAAATLVAVLLYLAAVFYTIVMQHPYLGDFLVYYAGGESVNPLREYPYTLYENDMTSTAALRENFPDMYRIQNHWLYFTYPPFAALLFAPLTLLPFQLAGYTHLLVCALIALYIARVAVKFVAASDSLLSRTAQKYPLAATFMLGAVLLVSHPWRESLWQGQINPVVMALVIFDLVRPARRIPRGVFIGVAAGIKLTPMVTALVFVVRRDYRSIALTIASAAATALLGFALLPRESVTYWAGALWDTERVGQVRATSNISLQGVLSFTGLHGIGAKAVFLILALGVVVVSGWLIHRLDRQGFSSSLPQACVVLMLAIYLSPISWSHHAVALPVLCLLGALLGIPAIRCASSPAVTLLAAGALALTSAYLVIAPMQWAKYLARMWRQVGFFPLGSHYTGDNPTELVLGAAASAPVALAVYTPMLALAVFTVLWARSLRAQFR